MPIIQKDEVMPQRPVIIVLYGVPGAGKTSVAITSNNPLLIDTDRGFDRSVGRVDTLVATNWEDVVSEVDSFEKYDTIVVDTAKSTLDDYLAEYVCRQNYKLKTNGLKRFGEMAEQFKAFVNTLRSKGKDIIFVCHDKEVVDGDNIKHSPDCTGQSKDLLVRIADQVGYVGINNMQRVITFNPLDNFVGKNVANIPPTIIPDATSKEFSNCMAEIIKSVKDSIQAKTETQREVLNRIEALRNRISLVETLEDVTSILESASELPSALKIAFFNELKTELEGKGFMYDSEKKSFVKNEADNQGNTD